MTAAIAIDPNVNARCCQIAVEHRELDEPVEQPQRLVIHDGAGELIALQRRGRLEVADGVGDPVGEAQPHHGALVTQ